MFSGLFILLKYLSQYSLLLHKINNLIQSTGVGVKQSNAFIPEEDPEVRPWLFRLATTWVPWRVAFSASACFKNTFPSTIFKLPHNFPVKNSLVI